MNSLESINRRIPYYSVLLHQKLNDSLSMILEQVLEHNKKFVEDKAYEPFRSDKYPQKKVAILTCMDTRLVELLPAAMGYKNGDVKVIKNAGGIISHPYGSVIRSLIIAIYKLGVSAVWVVGHTDCGMENLNVKELLKRISERGISDEVIKNIAGSGIDYEKWLGGFDCPRNAILQTMEQIRNHPLIPNDILIEGMLMNSTTGELTLVKDLKATIR